MLTRVAYTLEVMKGGQIVENCPIQGKAYVRFGRAPTNEVQHTHSLADYQV